MRREANATLAAVVVLAGMSGCSTREMATGAAVGGAAYEYSNKRAMDDLKKEYESGRLTREEYERRKKEIGDRSVVY
ncbi:MAG: hypothetical protein ABR553_04640 [Gammaproteobacteria bacterium]